MLTSQNGLCSTPLSTGQKTPGPWDEVSAVLVSDDLMTCKEQSRCAKLRAEAAVEFDTVVNDIGLAADAGVSDSHTTNCKVTSCDEEAISTNDSIVSTESTSRPTISNAGLDKEEEEAIPSRSSGIPLPLGPQLQVLNLDVNELVNVLCDEGNSGEEYVPKGIIENVCFIVKNARNTQRRGRRQA